MSLSVNSFARVAILLHVDTATGGYCRLPEARETSGRRQKYARKCLEYIPLRE